MVAQSIQDTIIPRDDKDYIKQWFEKADHDILAVQLALFHEPYFIDIGCFHCQQAVEKYLKAYLIFKKHPIKKTHNINELRILCVSVDKDFDSIDFKGLHLFADEDSFPADDVTSSLEEAKEYLQIAEDIKKLVLRKVDLG